MTDLHYYLCSRSCPPCIWTGQSPQASHSQLKTPTRCVLQCPCKSTISKIKAELFNNWFIIIEVKDVWRRDNRGLKKSPQSIKEIPQFNLYGCINVDACVCMCVYLCTKRLLSRYARAVLSWYANRMRVAKSKLYFLTWRKDRSCNERHEWTNKWIFYENTMLMLSWHRVTKEMNITHCSQPLSWAAC